MFWNRKKNRERKTQLSGIEDCSFPFQISTQIIKKSRKMIEKWRKVFFSFSSCLSVIDFQRTFSLRLSNFLAFEYVLGLRKGEGERESDIIEALLDCDAAYFFAFYFLSCFVCMTFVLELFTLKSQKKDDKKNASLTIDNYRFFAFFFFTRSFAAASLLSFLVRGMLFSSFLESRSAAFLFWPARQFNK